MVNSWLMLLNHEERVEQAAISFTSTRGDFGIPSPGRASVARRVRDVRSLASAKTPGHQGRWAVVALLGGQ